MTGRRFRGAGGIGFRLGPEYGLAYL